MAVSKGWSLKHIDISNVFHHRHLEERILMWQPIWFMDEERLSCLFPEKVALRFEAIVEDVVPILETKRFEGTHSDASIFVRKSETPTIYILVYVDDMVVNSYRL